MRWLLKEKVSTNNIRCDLWFAWYPVKTFEGHWAWLEVVKFKYSNSDMPFERCYYFLYDKMEVEE